MVADLSPGKETWIAGRLLPGKEDGLLLRDATGGVTVALPSDCAAVAAGDIVDFCGALEEGLFSVRKAIRLAPGGAVPPVASPNAPLWRMGAEPFERRAALRREVRGFFESRGFLEVETPCLRPAGGQEPYLDPFRTQIRTRSGRKDAFLITSPEYCHKRLLAAGCEKIFELARVFRDGPDEGGDLHWFEFTMLEWYRAYASYEEIMADVESLVGRAARNLAGVGASLLASPFRRLTVAQAFDELAGIDLGPYLHHGADDFAADAARSGQYGLSPEDSPHTRFFKILVSAIEPRLADLGAVFLTDYPAAQASLSKINEDDPSLCERFELYLNGIELANGFTELNDPREQERRFGDEAREKKASGMRPVPEDRAFLEALELGMPPSGGVALGFDRLAMVLFGETDLRPLLPFSGAPWA